MVTSEATEGRLVEGMLGSIRFSLRGIGLTRLSLWSLRAVGFSSGSLGSRRSLTVGRALVVVAGRRLWVSVEGRLLKPSWFLESWLLSPLGELRGGWLLTVCSVRLLVVRVVVVYVLGNGRLLVAEG